MKAKYVLETERGPASPEDWEKWEAARAAHKPNPLPPWKVGDVNDRHDSYWQVRMGNAVPDDDECREACGLNDEQIAERIEIQRQTRSLQLTGNPALDADDDDEVTDE